MRWYAFALCALAQVAAAQAVRDFDPRTVERLGQAIYEHDRAAWVATDLLAAEHRAGRVTDAKRGSIRGWIVVESPEQYLVKFVAEGPDGPSSVFASISTRGRREPVKPEQPMMGPLSDAEAAMYRARQLALGQIRRACAPRYNPVVLPNVGAPGYLVYLLAATGTPHYLVYGGHYRVTVSADGRRVLQAEELSRTCGGADLAPAKFGEVQGDAMVRDEVVVLVHEVSRRPLETHVYLGLLHGKDIGVATGPDTVWMVSKGRIVGRPPR